MVTTSVEVVMPKEEPVIEAAPTTSPEDARASLLSQRNIAQAELQDVQTQFDTLKANETTSTDQAVVSDAGEVDREQNDLKTIESPDDPTREPISLLDAEIERNQAQLNTDLASIQKTFDATRGEFKEGQLKETGSTSVGLAEAGGYLGFSGSGTGVMLTLAKSHRSELANLAAKRQAAIAEAKAAAANRQMNLVREKAQYVQNIDQEIYNRQQDYQDKVFKAQEEERVALKERQTQQDVFNAIERTGSQTPEDIFRQLNGKVPIEEINSFLEGLVPDSVKDVGSGFKFTTGNTAKLLGAGLSADDIAALNEAVNDEGYTEEIRSELNPIPRAAADKIFRSVAKKVTGEDGPASTEPMDVWEIASFERSFGYTPKFGMSMQALTEFENAHPNLSAEEKQEVMNAIGEEGGGQPATETINKDYFIENFTKTELTKLVDKLGFSKWFDLRFTDQADMDAMFESDEFQGLIAAMEESLAAGLSMEEAKAKLIQ